MFPIRNSSLAADGFAKQVLGVCVCVCVFAFISKCGRDFGVQGHRISRRNFLLYGWWNCGLGVEHLFWSIFRERRIGNRLASQFPIPSFARGASKEVYGVNVVRALAS